MSVEIFDCFLQPRSESRPSQYQAKVGVKIRVKVGVNHHGEHQGLNKIDKDDKSQREDRRRHFPITSGVSAWEHLEDGHGQEVHVCHLEDGFVGCVGVCWYVCVLGGVSCMRVCMCVAFENSLARNLKIKIHAVYLVVFTYMYV